MRTFVAIGIFVLAMQTAAHAGINSGGLGRACKFQCNIIGTGPFQQLKPGEQACVSKCVAAKKAAQH